MRKYSLNDNETFRLDELVDNWLFAHDEELKTYINQLRHGNKDTKQVNRFILHKVREWCQLNVDANPSVYRPY